MLTYNVLNEYVERMKKNDLVIVSTTNDIKTLTTDDINKLRAGDIVLKEDESGKHAYVVSYKKDGTGICLTYTDATYIETISYDYNSVTKEWTYNSMDATEVQPKLIAGDNIAINNNVISTTYTAGANVQINDGVISATDTTYTAGSGINITDGVISSSSGSLYKHNINIYSSNNNAKMTLFVINSLPTMTYKELYEFLNNNNFKNNNNLYFASGYKMGTSSTWLYQLIGIYATITGSLNDISGYFSTIDFSVNPPTISKNFAPMLQYNPEGTSSPTAIFVDIVTLL